MWSSLVMDECHFPFSLLDATTSYLYTPCFTCVFRRLLLFGVDDGLCAYVDGSSGVLEYIWHRVCLAVALDGGFLHWQATDTMRSCTGFVYSRRPLTPYREKASRS